MLIRRLFASVAIAAVLLLPMSAALAAPSPPTSSTPTALPTSPDMGGGATTGQANPANDVQATVTSIQKDWVQGGNRQMQFTATGDDGKTYRVDTSQGYTNGLRFDLKMGTRVILELDQNPDGTTTAFLADVVRTGGVLWVFLLFMVVTVAVGLWRGVAALFAFGVTLAVLFGFVFPHILAGGNPVVYTLVGGIVMLGVNMHVSHGFTRSTLAAYLGTLAGLTIALGASALFLKLSALTGLATEESNYLFWRVGAKAWPQGILMAGILLGTAGVLDDVTVTQSETVQELMHADPTLGRRELFMRAMRLGRHHIASTVNTLVLAYAGAAMPLFLLSMSTPDMSAQLFLNTEQVAEEIARTLAGTVALILAVPIATACATWLTRPGKGGHGHVHSHA